MKKFNIKTDFDVEIGIREEVKAAARYVVYEIPHIVQLMVIMAVLFTPWFIAVPVTAIAILNFFYGNRYLFKNVLKNPEEVEDVIHPVDVDTTKK